MWQIPDRGCLTSKYQGDLVLLEKPQQHISETKIIHVRPYFLLDLRLSSGIEK